jgi:hypothetical protein
MSNLSFDAETIRVMRRAYSQAISRTGVTAQSDREAIARFVMMACKDGVLCPECLAAFAALRFQSFRSPDAMYKTVSLDNPLLPPSY